MFRYITRLSTLTQPSLEDYNERHKTYADYIKAITGPCLGFVLRTKERILKKSSIRTQGLKRVNKILQKVSGKTKDPDYKNLHYINTDADAKRLINKIVLTMEDVKREIDSKSDDTDKQELAELSRRMFRGQYIVKIISRAY